MRKALVVLALGFVLAASAPVVAAELASPSPEALLAQVFAAAPLETPIRLVDLPCTECDCPGCYTTATASGTGTTCTNAQNALRSQLVASAFCSPVCQFVVTYTQACTQVGAHSFQVSGYAKHGCRYSC